MKKYSVRSAKAISLQALEPRLLLDGAAVATLADIAIPESIDNDVDNALQALSVKNPSEDRNDSFPSALITEDVRGNVTGEVADASRAEVVFIDTAVVMLKNADIDDIVDSIDPDIPVYFIDSSSDGITQISEVLSHYSEIDAVHIISHGEQGQLYLGTGILDSHSMQTDYLGELAALGDALSDRGDILLYGCDFSAGVDGQAATELLSQLTGADVAASVDLTGAADKGGDWDLEVNVGTVERRALSATAFTGLLMDTDGDGVDDADDLDTDNDGILDTDEGYSVPLGTAIDPLSLNSPNYPRWNQLQAPWIFTGDGTTATVPGLFGGLIDFEATLINDGNGGSVSWGQGAQIRSIWTPSAGASIDKFFLQSRDNGTFANDHARYTFDFNSPVQNLSFITGGINESDTVVYEAYYQGVAVAITSANFSNLDAGVSVVTGNTLQGGSGTSGGTSVDQNRGTLTLAGPIDQIVVRAGNGDGSNSNVTLGIHTFNGNLISTALANTSDTDGDGIDDHLDLDSDNDGISDLLESGADASLVDTDGDGVYDNTILLGAQVDANGVPIAAGGGITPINSDNDSLNNVVDLDSDNDGIPDVIEGQPTGAYVPFSGTDSDNDGIDNAWDTTTGHGGNFVAVEDTDSDGTADYIDTDSDDDGASDVAESGLSLIGTDTNNDGIDDGVNASYLDPDGDVNVPLSALQNIDTDPAEADYRSVNDLDWDGVPDHLDGDIDGDGILNANEGFVQNFSGQYNFTHNESNGTATSGAFATNAPDSNLVIASSQSTVVGAGLIELDSNGNPATPGSNYEYNFRGVDTPDLAGAIASDDYIELTFSTLPSYTSDQAFLDSIFHGTQNTGGNGTNFTDFDMAVIASDNGFATPGDVLVNSFTVDRDDSSYNFRFVETGLAYDLLPGTTYSFRFYFFNDQGVGNFASNGNVDEIGRITVDDTYFSVTGNSALSTGGSVANNSNYDADNDGISDLRESGNVVAIAADSNNDGHISTAEAVAAGFTDNDGDGAWDQLNVIPIDTDGDGIADYLDPDSDNDGITDLIENQSTSGFQPPSGTDTDGDGVDDVFDDPAVMHGGDFGVPEDTDGDGIPDYLDTDSDNDGIADSIDTDFRIAPDSDKDGDGIFDSDDIDDDNDGMLDTAESPPLSFLNDRSLFLAGLGSNNTVIDSGGAFAADPVAQSGLASLSRSGSINGDPYAYTVYDVDFSNAPTGTIDPGLAGDDIFELDNLNVETPAAQGGAAGTGSWGVDSVTGSTSTRNAVLFDFTTTPGNAGIGHFGVDLLDFESSAAGRLAEYRIYDNGNLVDSGVIDFADGSDGNGVSRFWGYAVSSEDQFFDQVVIVIGDDTVGGQGFGDRWAADNFTFGTAILEQDGDGIANHCDLDSDNDGISDLYESGASAVIIAADTNNDGTISLAEAAAANGGVADADGDGLMDIFDVDSADPTAVASVGSLPVDADADGIEDYHDLDSDNDGIPDAVEAQPSLGYQSPSIGTDTDSDGIVDTFDDPTIDHGGAFATPEDTDGDSTPDYLDLDSDDDGLDDTTESGLTPGADTDTDGIADNIAPNSYDDTDGVVSNPVNDLDNIADTDLSEVDYRSVNDKDWDGVSDNQDRDQDGDGILDTDESLSTLPNGTLIETVLGGTGITTDEAAWTNVLNSLLPGQAVLEDFESFAIDTPLDGQSYNGFSIAAQNLAGVDREYDIDSTQYGTVPLSGDRQATIHLTRTGGDQVQVTLTLNEPVIGFGINLGDIHDGNGTTTLDIAFDGTSAWSSTDYVGGNGVGAVTDDLSGETQTFGNSTFGFIGSYNANSPISEITMTYGIGQGDSFTFDDITLIYPYRDTDGDGIPDHCDFDSDNDGISDLVESGDAVAIAADTDLDGVITDAEALAYGLTPNGDGTYAELTYNSVDTDGDGIQDYLDLDSDNDGIPDAVEAQPTAGYQSPSIGADLDNDGVVDSFDDPSVEHGGAFALPVDSDWDGTPDYLDTDSDNDSVDDSDESGLILSGANTDADGIDDAVAPNSYADTDGIVSNPASDLDNEISDTFEVAYREVPITLGLAKAIVGQPVTQADGSFAVTYEVVVENTGHADLIDLSVIESMAAEFGPAFVSASNLSMSTAAGDPASSIAIDTAWNGGSVSEFIDNSTGTILKAGDSFAVQFVAIVNPTSSALDNQVIARGTGVDHDGNPIVDGTGTPIMSIDFSDSGTDADGTNLGEDGDTGGSDDPTPLYLPLIGLAKEAGDPVPNGDNFDVPFTLNWQNNGNVDLANVVILDDIMSQFGGQFAGLTIDSVTTSSTAMVAANGAWSGDTTQSLITHTGNPLAVGDTIQVVFTVTIDPNAAPASSNGLENSATTRGIGINLTTGAPDTALISTDISDNGADPATENGLDENADGIFANDPTPIALPKISVAKEVFGTPVPLANDNFSVIYQLVVENTGNVDLAELSLDDNIASQFGAAFVSAGSLTLVTPPSDIVSNIVVDPTWDGDASTEMIDETLSTLLSVGDSFTVQVIVEVDPDATGTSAPLDNQATVGGDAVDDNGNPLTNFAGTPLVVADDSDNGADPATDNGTGTTNDPTPLLIGDLKLGKQANAVDDVPGLSGVFDVTYLVVIENTGTIELENLQITDDITLLTNFGDAYDPSPITGPTDRSGFVAAPVIVGHTLANPADLPTINAGFLGGAGQTTIFDGTSGAMQAGEQITVAYTVRIDGSELLNGPDATTASDPGNQVQGSADSSVGPVSDDSDDGLNPNTDNGEGTTDDPTPFEIPQVRLWKEHSDAINNGDGTSTITVTLRVENSGTVPLSDLSLTEDMASQFGAAFISTSAPVIDASLAPSSTVPAGLLNTAWVGDTSQDMFDVTETSEMLVPGEEFSINFDVLVDPDLLDDDSDYLTNSADVTALGENYDGNIIQVSDQSGLDTGTGFDSDEPSKAIIPEIAVAKAAGDAIANGDNWDVPFTLLVENTGSVDLNQLSLFDDITTELGYALVNVSGLMVQNFTGSGTAPTANTAWEADTTLNLFNSDGNLVPGDRLEVVFTTTIDPDGIDSVSQALDNQATVRGNAVDEIGNPLTSASGIPLIANDDSDSGTSPQGSNTGENGDTGIADDPTPIIIADVAAAKEVVGTPTLLSNGNFEATYLVVIENIGTVDLANLTLAEDLSAQFGAAYVNAYDLSIVTAPADAGSAVTLDSANWNGGTITEMINTAVPSKLAVGDSFDFEFTAEINESGSTLNNTVIVGGDAVDANGNTLTDSTGNAITASDDSDSGADTSGSNPAAPGDNSTSDDPTPIVLPEVADLVTVKTLASGDGTPEEGSIVTFEIAVTNDGRNAATGVSLTDLLPNTLTATLSNGTVSQGSYDAVTGVWTVGALAVGETALLTLEGTVNVGEGGNTITNITTAALGDQLDPGTAGDDLTEAVMVDPNADLVTVKTLASGNSDPVEGETVTFQIAVDNSGAAQATNVTLTDFLPAGLTATSNNGTASQGTYDAVTGIWTIGTLSNGASAILTLEGSVDVGQGGNTISNITTAAGGDQPDPGTVGDDLEESVVVDPNADLVTVKTLASGDSVPEEGDTVTFLIVVDNAGAAQATNVSLTDLLPAGITATSNNGTTSQGVYDAVTGAWTIGTIANGDSATLTLEGIVDVGEGGSTINNITTAANGDQPDPGAVGDDLEEFVVVDPNADLVTVKTLASNDSFPKEGDTVTYQIVVDNTGGAQATNVSLADLLPAGLTATSNNGIPSQGAYDAVTGIWTIGTLADGGSAILILEGIVDAGEGGNTIDNITTAASGDQPDPRSTGDDLEESINVDPTAELITVKTLASGNSVPEEGDIVSFQIVVDNAGAAQARNVSLTDLLPAGLTATASNGVVSQGAYDTVTGIWTIGTINDGGSATLLLEGVVDVGEGGNTITNITTAAAGDQPDPSTVGDDLEESVEVDPNADLVTVKTLASGDSVPEEGDTVTFQIVVDNNGSAQASNVSLIDLLPAGLTPTANNGTASQGSYDAVTGIWAIGIVAEGDSATITLEGTVDIGEGGNIITNITTAANGDQPDPSTIGDDLEESVVVDPNADLVTVKTLTGGNSIPEEGETVAFQIVVENNGSAQATNVSLTDLLPAGLTATGNNGTVSQGSYDLVTGIWTIGTVAYGGSATLVLEGTVDVGEGGNTISNITTAASGDQPDPDTSGDDLQESIVVDPDAELVTVKTLASSNSVPEEGETVTFQIVVANTGAAQATNVSLTDLLPAGLTATVSNGTVSQGSYDAVTGIWTIGTLGDGGSATLSLEGIVDAGEGGNTISNITTAASGDQPDPSMAGDDLKESVSVDPNADLVTVKTLASGNSVPAEGDTVTFQILVENTGAAQATNVSLTDLLPPGLTATTNNGTVSQGTYDAVTGIWTAGTIADGGSATLILEGTVNVGEGGNSINNITAAASGDQPDPGTVGDDLEESVAVDPNADLVTVKMLASGNSIPAEGDTVSFQIVVDNTGTAQAKNVSLTDLLPAGLTATANNGAASQGVYDAATGVWSIGSIANGSSAILTLEGTVDVGQGGNTINNITTAASGDQPDPGTAGDDLEESVAVDPNADLVTVKILASGDNVPEEGDTVTFQIVVDNNGSAQATNVSLADLLPDGLTATANNGTVSQGAYDPVTGGWTIGTIADGGSAILTLEGTVEVGQGGNTISNITTAASGDQPDPSTLGDDLEELVVVDPNADLVTVKSLASGDSVPEEGDTVTFQIVVDNNGSAQATNVSLTDLLPAGLTATANNGTVSQGSYDAVTGIWTIGTMAGGGSAILALEGIVDIGEGGNSISNITTTANGDQPDPSAVGDDLEESVSVDPNADLVTVKSLASDKNIPEEGDTVTFQIVVDNAGSAQATNVSLTDLLPAGLTATTNNGTVSQGAYDAVSGIWAIGTVADGGTATLTLEGTVDAGEGGNTITNITTAASGDQPDPSTEGDDLDEVVEVDSNAELVTVKTLASGNSVPLEGETVTFQIVVDNNGAAQATNVSLTDLLPAGLTATANNGIVSQGTYDVSTGVWIIGTVADGGTATLTLEGTVDAGEGGNTITNITTAASGDQLDPSTVGDDLDEAVVVDPNADLVTVKTLASGNSVPAEGETVTFQIVVDNDGAAQANNVSLTDFLPAGLSATANNGIVSQGAYDAVTGIWTIGTVADGGTATLTLEGIVNAGEGGNTITNVTTAASGDQPDPSTVGDDLDEAVVVDPNADLVTVKTLTSGDSVPEEGDTVTFQIVVDNNGPSQATNVSLTDLLPVGLTAAANNGIASQGSYDAVTGIWTIGTVTGGGSATLTLQGTVNIGEGGNTISNITTAASGDQPDPTMVGDDLEESVAVDPNADLVTVKTLASGNSVPEIGDTVTFQIVVENNGTAQATNVMLTDRLPAGLTGTVANGLASQGSYDVATGVWTIGTLANGASATLTLEGTVNEGGGGNAIDNVTTAATADQPDPSAVGDDLVESVLVSDRPTEVIATADTVETTPGTPVIVDFLANDINDDNGTLSLLGAPVLQNPSSGTLTLVDGDWVFTPEAGFIGEAVISYTLQDEFENTATSTHTVVVAGATFVEPPVGQLIAEVFYVEAPAPREIALSDYQREYYRSTVSADLVILQAVASLSATDSDELQVRPLADTVEGSIGYSSGKGYRGTHSVDPTDECGRFFIDTIVRDEMLSVIARSTINPERSSGVVGFSVSLANGLPLPAWVSEIADGEYLIDRTADTEVIGLKLMAHRQDGSVLTRFVEIDTLTGEITESDGVSDFGTSFSEELRTLEFPASEVSDQAANTTETQ